MQLFGSRTGEMAGTELRRQFLLWVGALGGADAWSLHLLAIYANLPIAGALGSTWAIHVVTRDRAARLVTSAASVGA